MKKIKISDEQFDIKKAVDTNEIKPSSNEKAYATVHDGNLCIELKSEIKHVKECYLVAYDKKVSKAINSFKITDINQSKVKINGDAYWKLFDNVKNFNYARLCIAVGFEDAYSYFYLNSDYINADNYSETDSYVGAIYDAHTEEKKLVIYYSNAGQLSIKFMGNSEYYLKIANCKYKNIYFEKNKLFMEIDGFYMDNNEVNLVWKSKTTDNVVTNIPFKIKDKQVISQTRQKILLELNLDDIVMRDTEAYYLSYAIGNFDFDIHLPVKDEMEDGSNVEKFLNEIYVIENDKKFQATFGRDEQGRLDLQIAEKIYPYMFSIIIAIHNTGVYLHDTFRSILEQDTIKLNKYIVGKESDNYSRRIYKNIYQVIMVNDGSEDDSAPICREYANQYNNFELIDNEENMGVSYARNCGIEIAKGKYLNFMDSDDKLSNNVFLCCFEFFEKHYDETDVITFPLVFFDGRQGDHWLNTKFSKGSRVVSLRDEYNVSTLTTSGSFFKAEAMGNIRFDTRLLTCEDAKVVYTLISDKETLGLVSDCTYFYRRRSDGKQSAVQSSDKETNYYIEYFDYFIDWISEFSIKKYGYIPNYMQYLIAQQLQWRIISDGKAETAKSVLDDEEFEIYKKRVIEAYSLVSDEIILKQEKLYREHKNYILQMKYNKLPEMHLHKGGIYLQYGNTFVCDLSTCNMKLHFMEISNEVLYISGQITIMGIDEKEVIKIALVNGMEKYSCDVYPLHKFDSYAMGDVIMSAIGFKCEIPLNSSICEYKLGILCEVADKSFLEKQIIMNYKTFPLSTTLTKSYYMREGWVVSFKKPYLCVENIVNKYIKYGKELDYEGEFVAEIKKKYNSHVVNEALALRSTYIQTKLNGVFTKKIWLISDRVNMAGDNGEAFFRYLLSVQPENIDYYFVINEGCADAERLISTGKVVFQNSRRHKMLHLAADVIISSHADDYIRNIFVNEKTTDIFRDLFVNKKFVFLQHGITKDDQTVWLNKYNQSIDGMVAAAIPEYEAFVTDEYYYNKEEIWLTGFPRFDRLYRDEKKIITIMPTWRRYLNKPNAHGDFINGVIDNFNESDYFAFYNALINDERLISAAKNKGYTIAFMPHPNIMHCLDMFKHNPDVLFFGSTKPYSEIYAESNLVVTDYSSSAMDFAYLRKPIVYCQFDAEEFWTGKHTYQKGYFDYEENGFGEVTYDLDTCVDAIIHYMDRDCELKDIYRERIDKFFAFNDQNNCERVYKKLLEI